MLTHVDPFTVEGFARLVMDQMQPWMLQPLIFFCALTLMLLAGDPMINWLRAKRWKKGTTVDETWTVREDTPDTHQVKQGTPSMGGIGIIGVAVLTFVSLGVTSYGWDLFSIGLAPDFHSVIIIMLLPITVVAHGLLGFVDDWSKATGRGGLRALAKLIVQIVLALTFVVVFLPYNFNTFNQSSRLFWLEAYNDDVLMLGSVAALTFVVIATGNAVNLTDGIDGLASGLAVQCGLIFWILDFYFVDNISFHAFTGFSIYKWFWAALAGSCLGFLWFNKHPARVFMGDTGSLAIGAALGAAAVLSGSVFLLPFIGFIFYVEMFSVIIQVLYFKWTKKTRGAGQRIFRRAPLHHHFELGGWSEWRVVGTFWLINAVTSVIGLVLWNKGILPRWP